MIIKFFAHIKVNANAVSSLLATHCFHPGSEDMYHGLNQSPELDRVRSPQCLIRWFLVLEMSHGVWRSKFSMIMENPASSTEGSLGFKRFHLSRPKRVLGCPHEHERVPHVGETVSSERFSTYRNHAQNAKSL